VRDRVLAIVRSAVDDLNEELGYPELENPRDSTPLHGDEAGIDSLSLVSLVVDLEGRVASELGREIVLADEKAMSSRNSPYRTVGSLVDFIVERIGADGAGEADA
jgi:acyl carrier protein